MRASCVPALACLFAFHRNVLVSVHAFARVYLRACCMRTQAHSVICARMVMCMYPCLRTRLRTCSVSGVMCSPVSMRRGTSLCEFLRMCGALCGCVEESVFAPRNIDFVSVGSNRD